MARPRNTFPYGYAKDGAGVLGMGTSVTIAQLETEEDRLQASP